SELHPAKMLISASDPTTSLRAIIDLLPSMLQPTGQLQHPLDGACDRVGGKPVIVERVNRWAQTTCSLDRRAQCVGLWKVLQNLMSSTAFELSPLVSISVAVGPR